LSTTARGRDWNITSILSAQYDGGHRESKMNVQRSTSKRRRARPDKHREQLAVTRWRSKPRPYELSKLTGVRREEQRAQTWTYFKSQCPVTLKSNIDTVPEPVQSTLAPSQPSLLYYVVPYPRLRKQTFSNRFISSPKLCVTSKPRLILSTRLAHCKLLSFTASSLGLRADSSLQVGLLGCSVDLTN
jgi:hypothetical protein